MVIRASSSSGHGTAITPPWPVSSSSKVPEVAEALAGAAGGAQAARPAPEHRRVKLVVAYLGTPFRGFALQPGQATVAGALVEALGKFLGQAVDLTCAGRTDAGVHALGQVVSFDIDAGTDLDRLQRALNKMLNPLVSVPSLSWAPPGFSARYSALSRKYHYCISCSEWPDPLTAPTTWHVGRPLDLRSMQAAADALLGEHDFSSFCHAIRGKPGPLVRRVVAAEWYGPDEAGPGRLTFEIEAVAFCHQMVRSIVGTLVQVGEGRRRAGDMLAVLAAKDRHAAGPIAPAHGLCLMEVRYPEG